MYVDDQSWKFPIHLFYSILCEFTFCVNKTWKVWNWPVDGSFIEKFVSIGYLVPHTHSIYTKIHHSSVCVYPNILVAAPLQNSSDLKPHLPQQNLRNEMTLLHGKFSGKLLMESRFFITKKSASKGKSSLKISAHYDLFWRSF